MQQKPGIVSTIVEYFEKKPTPVSASVVTMPNIHNNNGVCAATANQTLALTDTWADPQMALQSAAAGQPMGREDVETSGQLTSEEPIRARKPGPDQNQEDSSHIGEEQQKPSDNQGCSAGI